MTNAVNSKGSWGTKVVTWLRLVLATATVLLFVGSLASKAEIWNAAKNRAIESYQAVRIAYQLQRCASDLEKQQSCAKPAQSTVLSD